MTTAPTWLGYHDTGRILAPLHQFSTGTDSFANKNLRNAIDIETRERAARNAREAEAAAEREARDRVWEDIVGEDPAKA